MATLTQTITAPTKTGYTLSGKTEASTKRAPLQRNHALDKYASSRVTPTIGTDFGKEVQLSALVNAPNSDELLKDLAILVSQRNVVFFRAQDLGLDDQKKLGQALGRLSGKPAESTLHIHPLTEDTSPKGDQISIITSERRDEYLKYDPSRLASTGWHADITFEPVPSDYAILKVHTLPDSGGDTLWASAYEVYDRLSPKFAAFLETLEARHDANYFKGVASSLGNSLRTDARGHPDNSGDDLSTVHPVVRTNPVTGWKGVFINKGFTKRILGVTKDESDRIIDYLNELTHSNHDLQARLKWTPYETPGIADVAIWDNRSSFHTATWDYGKELRVGDRVVSIGEKPYLDPSSQSRRAALGIAAWQV